MQNKGKSTWGRIWYFIWKDDSVWSWIVNIILAFLLIKFIVYPGLGFVLGTDYPVVAVVSGSMEHDGSFDDWWNSDNCCKDRICAQSKTQEMMYSDYEIAKADFMNLQSGKKVRVGDVIVFTVPAQSDPIIHRVVKVSEADGEYYYSTKGDHNCGSSPFEQNIQQSRVLGKALQRVPFLGWIKIIFVEIISIFKW